MTSNAHDTLPRYVISGRGGGKTHAAAQWVRDDPQRHVLLVANEFLATEVCDRYGLPRTSVVNAHNALNYSGALRGRLRNDVELGIDDLDVFLNSVLLRPVTFITATGSCECSNRSLNHGREVIT